MFSKKTMISAVGSAVAITLGVAPVVSASDNPFAAQSLEKGYMVADASKMMDGMHDMREEIEKNGKISKEEFIKRHEMMFDKMDLNHDGFIDKAEFEKMKATKMKDGKCGEGKCGIEGRCGHNEISAEIEKKGKISKEEFIKHHEMMFDKMDLNHDGFIDKAEWEKARAEKRMMKRGEPGHDKGMQGEHKY